MVQNDAVCITLMQKEAKMGKAFRIILREAYNFPEQEVAVIKEVTKEWLRTVDLPDYGSPETIKKLLENLVDEPE